jgi:hypothetical protein
MEQNRESLWLYGNFQPSLKYWLLIPCIQHQLLTLSQAVLYSTPSASISRWLEVGVSVRNRMALLGTGKTRFICLLSALFQLEFNTFIPVLKTYGFRKQNHLWCMLQYKFVTRLWNIFSLLLPELLGFWTLSIVRNSKEIKHNVSETVSLSVLRRLDEGTYSVGPFKKR